MNILITRPLIDSEDLMSKLFSLGHKIIHIPTLKISATNDNFVDAQKYDAFIFTSANAVRFLNLKNEDKKIKCFCCGSDQAFKETLNGEDTIMCFSCGFMTTEKYKKSNLEFQSQWPLPLPPKN